MQDVFAFEYSGVNISLDPSEYSNSERPEVVSSDNVIISPIGSEDDKKIVLELLPMVSVERACNLQDCMRIGRSLHVCYDGSVEGLSKWVDFVSNDDILDEEDCNMEWRHMFDSKSMGLRNIGYYAELDSPLEYDEWNNIRFCKQLELALGLAHTDVARLVWLTCWTSYLCTRIDGNGWYYYDGNKWVTMDKGVKLRKYVSNEFRSLLERKRTNLSRQLEGPGTPSKKLGERALDNISALICKLGITAYKTCVVKELAEFFYDETFMERLDTNMHYTGLSNGVIEICKGEAFIRIGMPGDYISKSTNIRMPSDITYESGPVVECMTWFKKCFCDNELVRYFLRMSASLLMGGNQDKLIMFFLGAKGDNSKTTIKKLFEKSFGDYCATFNPNLFTKEMSNSGPSPELEKGKGTKVAFINEPSPDSPWGSSLIKTISGGDRYFARKNRDDGGYIESSFMLIILANMIPPMSPEDAVKNRLKSLPFDSTFVNDPPESEEERWERRIFKGEKNFSNRFNVLAPYFLWIIASMYTSYHKHGLKEPTQVIESTKQYWSDNDIYEIYIRQCLHRVTIDDTDEIDTNIKLLVVDAYTKFTQWMTSYSSHIRVPSRSVFINEMKKKYRLGNPIRDEWVGFTIKCEI
ncbi:MAG: hypothetical protein COA94_02360 [Rickettsiales bacterium]|nr:MAG: hypothetical protein COA94_02360 [Rickettsiales bacterium]